MARTIDLDPMTQSCIRHECTCVHSSSSPGASGGFCFGIVVPNRHLRITTSQKTANCRHSRYPCITFPNLHCSIMALVRKQFRSSIIYFFLIPSWSPTLIDTKLLMFFEDKLIFFTLQLRNTLTWMMDTVEHPACDVSLSIKPCLTCSPGWGRPLT